MSHAEKLVGIILFLLLMFGTGQAQVPQWSSIEGDVASSDIVVVGRIIGISGDLADENGRKVYSVTISVNEIIKGTAGRQCTFINSYFRDRTFFQSLMSHCTPLLWGLQEPVFSQAPLTLWRMIPLKSGGAPPEDGPYDCVAFTMDYKVLTKSEEILSCARLFERLWPGRHQIDYLKYFPLLIGSTLQPRASGWLEVPVVNKLEVQAHEMIQRPDKFLPKGSEMQGAANSERLKSIDEFGLRRAGIQILHNFKNSRNILIMKRMAHTPTSDAKEVALMVSPNQAARQVLQDWRISTDK